MATLNFNANDVEPSEGFDTIPAGEYPMVFTESEMKDTKNGDGQYLQLVAQVIDGEYKNRLIWVRLNLINSNEKAAEIAQKDLSAICRAVGVMTPGDSSELHDIPFMGKVKIKKGTNGYEDSNEIKAYSPYQAVAQPAPAKTEQAPAQQTPAPAQTGGGLPWNK